MKSYFAFLATVLFLLQCKKEPTAIELPTSVNFQESQIFLNGEIVDFKPIFIYKPVYKHIGYSFLKKEPFVNTSFSFDWLPVNIGSFGLHTERIQYIKALTSFGQSVDDDLEGYSYDLEDANEGYFNVTAIDTIKQEVQGNFKVKFCRTSKNGNKDLGLPKILLFQGIFFENYEVK